MSDTQEHAAWTAAELERVRNRANDLEATLCAILDGFTDGVFVRSTKDDDEPGWAIKLLPYIQTLARASELVGYNDD